ncbi:hypothetical protein D3C71_1851140 [compost metagenome]
MTISSGHRYWFHEETKRMVVRASMLVRDSGSSTSKKKRTGPEPSMRAASASSSGRVMKNCR